MRSAPRLASVVVAAVLPLAAGAGCFTFDRLNDIVAGSINGRTIDAVTTDVVPFTRVRLEASTSTQHADKDGAFSVAGLPEGGWVLRMGFDEEGDGINEATALRAVLLSPYVGGDGATTLGTVLLGDVPLDPTAVLDGRIVDDAGAPVPGCKVAVWRAIEDLDPDQAFAPGDVSLPAADLGVEASTGSDDEGKFRLAGVTKGTVLVGAFCSDGRVSLPKRQAVRGGDNKNDFGDLVLVEGTRRTVQIRLVPAPGGDDEVRVDFVTTGGDRIVVGDVFESTTRPAGAVIGLEAPTGVWDVHVTVLQDGTETLHGLLQSQAVAAGAEVLEWGAVPLADLDPCVDQEDRDGDGVEGLPPFDLDPTSWSACAAECIADIGTGAATAVCEALGRPIDCDDDGDGQADVTEPACLGTCRGSDFDGDQLCEPVDPFPRCASNDPDDAACAFDDDAQYTPPPPVGGVVGDCGGVPDPVCGPAEDAPVYCTAHLDALAGCAALNSLTIFAPDVVDLSPLSSLVTVTGAVTLLDIGAVDLTGLDALTTVGSISINTAPNLTSLRGLQQLTTYSTFQLSDLTALTSFDGIEAAVANAAEASWYFSEIPNVVDTSALAGLTNVGSLLISGAIGGGLATFGAVQTVTNSLSFTAVPVTDLGGLVGVQTVNYLSFDQMPNLTSLAGMTALTSVQQLSIGNNPMLPSLDGFASLTSIGTLVVLSNGALTSIGTWPALATLDYLSIIDEDQLVNAGTFPSLTVLDAIRITDCDQLTRLPTFPTSLTTIGTIDLASSPALQLTGLEAITSVGFSIYLQSTGTTSLGPLANLKTVGAEISLRDLPLINIDGLSGLTSIVGRLYVEGCAALTSLPTFSALTRMGALQLEGDGALTDIGLFPALTSVNTVRIIDTPATGGQLGQSGGPQLTPTTVDLVGTDAVDLTLLAHMSTIAYLTIDRNLLLSSMTGTTSVVVTSALTATNNPMLKACEVDAYVTGLANTPSTTNTGNDEVGTCP